MRIDLDLIMLTCKDWPWISRNYVRRIGHRCHKVELWAWVRDLMKLSYNNLSWISWSWVMRLIMLHMGLSCKDWPWISQSGVIRTEHRSHVVAWLELIIDFMKPSCEDWSWISWSWAIRIDRGSHQFESWGLSMDLMKLHYQNWS